MTDISTNSSSNELNASMNMNDSSVISTDMEYVPQSHHQSPSHHHSCTNQMLPVHSRSQLEVILPIHSKPKSNICTNNSSQSVITRLKSGAIERKNNAAMIASFPELQSLQLTEDELFTRGYSFVYEISDISEPITFRKALVYHDGNWQCKKSMILS